MVLLMLKDASVRPQANRLEALTKGWLQLNSAGVTLGSAERQEVIASARSAWAGGSAPEGSAGLLAEAAHWVAADAGGLTAEVVADFERRGLSRLRYLEVVGVVARLSNVDFYARGLGASLTELPDPTPGDASGEVLADLQVGDGWVPSAGGKLGVAPFVLDALPAEGQALRALHEPMYVPFAEIMNGSYADDLTKPQIEYLAARTSYLNECFY